MSPGAIYMRVGPVNVIVESEPDWQRLKAHLAEERERVGALKVWQFEVAEGIGYINRAEGQAGYEVADAATIVKAWRKRGSEAEVADLRARVAEFERLQQVWLMSPEAASRLDGYRELAAKCASLEATDDDLRAQLAAAQSDLNRAREAYHVRWDADPAWTIAEMMAGAVSAYDAERERFKARGGELDRLEADLAEATRHVENLLPYAKSFWRPGEQPSAVIGEARAWLAARGGGR